MASVVMMVLFEDESLEVSYSDGSCLQLSPCGSEFVLVKGLLNSAHPLQSGEKVRQRTRFVISQYKELIVRALEFRNRFATRPYLPEELIPKQRRKHSLVDIIESEWLPYSALSPCGADYGPNSELTVLSVDGNARLLMSPSGQEFSVEFLCKASQIEGHAEVIQQVERNPVSLLVSGQNRVTQNVNGQNDYAEGLPNLQEAAARVDPRLEHYQGGGPAEPPKAHLYTWVKQHHSCSSPPLIWRYPLSLAVELWESQRRARTAVVVWKKEIGSWGASLSDGESCHLPKALPLRCPSPHQHRWIFSDCLPGGEAVGELGISNRQLKVLWSHGVLYRIVSGLAAAVVIEISPGDGSLIRSSQMMEDYFTHHGASQSEKTYVLSSLPPDIPGQDYSVRSVVQHASRILNFQKQARLSQELHHSPCCWREESIQSGPLVRIRDAEIPGTGHFSAFSDGRVHCAFLDRVTLQMVWNLCADAPTQGQQSQGVETKASLYPRECQLTLPNGQRQLVRLHDRGPYDGYVSAALQWCRQLEPTLVQSSLHDHNWSVEAELEKIRRFNFLLEHNRVLRTPGYCPTVEVVACSNRVAISQSNVEETLQKTSKTIQEINILLSSRASNQIVT